jgi:mannitol/fructose-specific phosphotransferase system IIA component
VTVLDLLSPQAVRLGLSAGHRYEAVAQAGALLLELDAIEPGYIDAMREREEMLSSYIGEGFAFPHGTEASRQFVKRAAIAFLQYPDGIDWDGEEVLACVAIASKSDEHITILGKIARILAEPSQAERLRSAREVSDVLDLLQPTGD